MRKSLFVILVFVLATVSAVPAFAQPRPFTLEQVLSYAFCYELVSARKADRIAWLENEEGRRNVYTAAAPDFRRVRLTSFMDDDGTDLSGLAISDDGAVVVFVRGHNPNRQGWIANPSHLPDGAEQAIWGVRTVDRKPFRIAAGSAPVLSPDGRRVLWVRDGQIYGAAVRPTVGPPAKEAERQPLFRTWGTNSSPRWSPDSRGPGRADVGRPGPGAGPRRRPARAIHRRADRPGGEARSSLKAFKGSESHPFAHDDAG
jgi:hypothetical protein